ncbi:ABC transporter permease [Tropicimonas sp.]|uniref:ABC transporter permease n=1 Tax=Tropicimonas sp. TaxID=2067044 RepID=UPI003A88D38F
MRGTVQGLAATALFLALWQALVSFGGMPRFILPGPWPVAEALWDNRALIAWHAGITLAEVLLGLFLGTALGVATALQLAVSPVARYLIRPALIATQALPVFALAPILTLWLGYGIWSKVLMAVLIIYFPVASAFFDGLMRTPPGWLDLGRTMGARPARLLWRVRVPAAVPSLVSGLRLAAVYAPIGAVVGEWVGAAGGLGYLMLLANGRVKIDLMFATLIVLAVLTLALHRAVGWLCDRMLTRLD